MHNLFYNMKTRYFSLIPVLYILSSCNFSQDKEMNSINLNTVYESTLPEFIDTIFTKELNVRAISYAGEVDYNRNNFLDFSKFENQRSADEKLILDSLSQYINKPLKNKPIFTSDLFNHLSFEPDSSENIDGVLDLTPYYYNQSKNLGAYYFAIFCGDNCSSGYILFFKIKDNEFVVEQIIRTWS